MVHSTLKKLNKPTCSCSYSVFTFSITLIPFLIGSYEDCYLLLLAICDMTCSFEVHPDDSTKLAWLVQTYLECFTSLYSPDFSVIPKMHYLVQNM